MISTFYQISNIADSSAREFIETAINDFYNEVDIHLSRTSRIFNEWHLVEYGEMTLVNFLINGILRNDETGFYNVLNEFGVVNPKDKSTGRADLIVEEIITKDIFYVEAKKCWSNENAPDSKSWKEENTKKDYKDIIDQAKKYLKVDFESYENIHLNDYYAIALVFDSVKFDNSSALKKWREYIPFENEFYAFKTYEHSKKIIGAACYGMIEKITLKPEITTK
ncbi:MAG: hypothetical protein ACOCWD_02160 [Tangfeifania sp.]